MLLRVVNLRGQRAAARDWLEEGMGGLVFKDYSSMWKRKHAGDELWHWLHQNQSQPDTSELHIQRELKGHI